MALNITFVSFVMLELPIKMKSPQRFSCWLNVNTEHSGKAAGLLCHVSPARMTVPELAGNNKNNSTTNNNRTSEGAQNHRCSNFIPFM